MAGITVNRDLLRKQVENSIGIVTALNPIIGYHAATEVAVEAHLSGRRVGDVVLERRLMTKPELEFALRVEALTTPGLVTPE